MKTIVLITALLVINSCKAQETKTNILTNNKMERPVITTEFEKLNLEDFKDGLVITKKKESAGSNKGKEFDAYDYRKDDTSGVRVLAGSYLGGFGYSFIAKNSYYDIIKAYYKNNYIKNKCIASSINSSIKIGKQYFFDKEGKLEKTIDHDLGWNYSYENVIQYLLDRKTIFIRDDIYFGAEITKEGNEKKYWQLIFDTHKTTGKSTWELVKLDAMTGETLCQIEYEGDREWHADIENPLPKQRIIVADKTDPKVKQKIFTTHKGKKYTEEEWRKYEEELYQKDKKRKK
jgi:hypothetical protein